METNPLSHSSDFIALCDDAKTRVTEISTDDVNHMLDNDETFYLIDVREKNEFDEAHLANATFMESEEEPIITIFLRNEIRKKLSVNI